MLYLLLWFEVERFRWTPGQQAGESKMQTVERWATKSDTQITIYLYGKFGEARASNKRFIRTS